MNLNQAIRHAKERACANYSYNHDKEQRCRREHLQLANWLRELKSYRKLASHNLTKVVKQLS